MLRAMPDLSASDERASQESWLPLLLRLNALATGQDDPRLLLEAAAREVLRACGAAEVRFYWAALGKGEAVRRSQRVECAGAASASQEASNSALGRRMRVAALGALKRTGVMTRYRPGRVRADGCPDLALAALALGGAQSQVVMALAVDVGTLGQTVSILEGAAPALATVGRVACLRRELERAGRRHAHLQAIFSHSSEAILTVDRSFHILEVNPAFEALLGWPDGSSLGKPCSTVLRCQDERGQPFCDTETCPVAQAFVLTNSAPYREVRWQTADGKSKEVSASFAAVPSPEGIRGVIIARDMTPVNAANRMRANFISMVSHELRTPLNSINGFLEIVLDGHVGSLTPRQDEFLNYARTSTHQLMTLVEDILFISRADTGQFKLRFDTVALPELVAQVVHSLEGTAARAEVQLCAEVPDDLPAMCADELRLQQVLTNLVNNAIKFTPPNGTVRLSAAVEGDVVCVEVRDTGEGVPIEERERIFERFYQSGATARANTGGYGLGLAIAKLIVEQHGGRIWVESRLGSGSSFFVTIPLNAAAAVGGA